MPAKNPDIPEKIAHQLEELGAQIRAQRKHLKINATVAAEAAGMSRITWYRIEKGNPAVTMGAWLHAITAVGLNIDIHEGEKEQPADRAGWIPARIRLAEYPQLRQLAWHVGETEALSPREALDIYERNFRHLDEKAMTPQEEQLLEALRLGLRK